MIHDLKAVIFDLDGTLVNSEELNYTIYRDYFRQAYGIDYTPEDHGHTIGFNDDDFINAVETRLKTKISKDHFFNSIHGKTPYHQCQLKTGANGLLEFLCNQHIKVALATNTSKEKLKHKTEHLNILPIFDLIITGEDVSHKKPNPEIYQLSVNKLGLAPNQCLVIEDSESGIIATISAGCKCFYVPHRYTVNPAEIANRHKIQMFSNLLEVNKYLSGMS